MNPNTANPNTANPITANPNTINWTDKVRTIAGLRHDRFSFDVDSNIPENSGKVTSSIKIGRAHV